MNVRSSIKVTSGDSVTRKRLTAKKSVSVALGANVSSKPAAPKKVPPRTTIKAKVKVMEVSVLPVTSTSATPGYNHSPTKSHQHYPLPVITRSVKAAPPSVTPAKRHPLGHLLVESLFKEAGFRGTISTDKTMLDRYSTDESIFSVRPQLVLIPKTRRDVEIAVSVIAKETKRFSSLSLTPRAAGTGLSGGSLTDSIMIDVCPHLNSIGEVIVKKTITTFTCEPGAMWRDVEKKLRHHGAYLPSYPSSKDICSIGGAVGNNAAGPDSYRYGHTADWVLELEVVLCDGHTYTIKPLDYREFKLLSKQKHEHARIAREAFALIEKNELEIMSGKPKTPKNTAGYALWKVFSEGVEAFKAGKGTFDLTRLICGSQGTIGIIVGVTMRTIPIDTKSVLVSVPVFDLQDAASVVLKAMKLNPINIEFFDALTFDLALKNPAFFKQRLTGLAYYRTMLTMYSTYHIRYGKKTPEFTILVTLDSEVAKTHTPASIVEAISGGGAKARVVTNSTEAEMLWQIRRASYSLSKFQDPQKRPAAFLEDMTVPPEHLSKFFTEIKALFKEFNVAAAVHGHGGNGHFHFYPLLDFTNPTTPLLVERMAERFYNTAIKYKGSICGEHNDGIMRTPYLNKMFTPKMLQIFKEIEHLADPDDIFNPGKKVNPRFDIKTTMRKTN